MKPGRRAVEMTGAWKTKENQTQGSLRFPQPLEIATRFPHSHNPMMIPISKKPTQRKETLRRIASLPPSGSFFDEKMLLPRLEFGLNLHLEGPSSCRRRQTRCQDLTQRTASSPGI